MRIPPRALGSRYGALVMLSMPPATMMSALPAMSASCASIAASIAEPHILLTVVQAVASGKPAFSEACRSQAPDFEAAPPVLCARRGRRTSSPWQFGQTPFRALAHVAQYVHS